MNALKIARKSIATTQLVKGTTATCTSKIKARSAATASIPLRARITKDVHPRYLNQPSGIQRTMSSSAPSAAAGGLNIENTNIKSVPGVILKPQQTTIVGSVLDLFAGRPSLAKLQLWADDAVFEDPIAHAKGRKEFEAQWYGLQTAFSEIERLGHEVTSAGNPIVMNLKTRYVVKGISKEQTIDSVVNIFVDQETGKITKLQDKWNGELPDGSIKNAFRRLNATIMPKVVNVPNDSEDDRKRGN